MESKSDRVRRLVAAGQFKEALRIAKGFRRGISKEDSDAMQRGYECLVHARFFKELGWNPSEIAQKGIETVSRLFAS